VTPEDEIGDGACGQLVHVWDDVGVDVERDRDGAWPRRSLMTFTGTPALSAAVA
jgi:hypothetical protein